MDMERWSKLRNDKFLSLYSNKQGQQPTKPTEQLTNLLTYSMEQSTSCEANQ